MWYFQSMINYAAASTIGDLLGILDLQRQNLKAQLSPQEIKEQGFVTVEHRLEDLVLMSEREESVVALENHLVIGYVLAMTRHARDFIPILEPMFDILDHLRFKDISLSGHPYIMIGQVCIDKHHRGIGVFEQMYETFRIHYKNRYALAVTEIAVSNLRSMRAHVRIGFETIHTYTDPNGEEWNIVAWDWR